MKLLRLTVVLAAIADDESSVEGLRGARVLADAAGATLHVIHVAPGGGALDGMPAVKQLLERADVEPGRVTVHVLDGDPALAIRSLADRIRADVIVLGKHRGRAAGAPGMGSTALAVVTNSWAPCLVLSERLRLPLSSVLVPVDLSDTSRGALVVALSWASALRCTQGSKTEASDGAARLTALVVTAPGAASPRELLEGELQQLRTDAGGWAQVEIEAAVVSGKDVTATIADSAREQHSDLIVLGTRGLGSDPVGRLGSVSLGVLQRVMTPVLLVPPAVCMSLQQL